MYGIGGAPSVRGPFVLTAMFEIELESLPDIPKGLPQLSELTLEVCDGFNMEDEGQYSVLKELHGCGCEITLPDRGLFCG